MSAERIAEQNPDALLADGLEGALVGYTIGYHRPTVAVYDIDLCLDVLAKRDGATHEDAEEFLCSNTLLVSAGENAPIYVKFLDTP